MPAVVDELTYWGVERFSVEALAERHHLDTALIYRYWGDRQRLIVGADHLNTKVGRTMLRGLVMYRRGHHDQDTRMLFWRERFAAVRGVVDRARERGEIREGVAAVAAVQLVLAPLNIRAVYSEEAIDDGYCVTIADLAWHALARE